MINCGNTSTSLVVNGLYYDNGFKIYNTALYDTEKLYIDNQYFLIAVLPIRFRIIIVTTRIK